MQLINTSIRFAFNLQHISNTCIGIFIFFGDFDNLNLAFAVHPVNRQRVCRFATWTYQGLTYHCRATALQFFVKIISLGIAECRVSTCSTCDATNSLAIFTDLGGKLNLHSLESSFSFFAPLVFNSFAGNSVEIKIKRCERFWSTPRARLLSKVLHSQTHIYRHVILLHFSNQGSHDSANCNDVFGCLNVVISQISKRNESRDITFQLDLRSKISVGHDFSSDFLSRSQ
mmetsp:Transcript_19255/g.47948  ORF Transcript_19255/g.47948 Transcript_19255/m.47948 type:complete len:229 (+) Transcript_19255:702-1388(+)